MLSRIGTSYGLRTGLTENLCSNERVMKPFDANEKLS